MPADLMSSRVTRVAIAGAWYQSNKSKEVRILPAREWLPPSFPSLEDRVSIRIFALWVIIPRLLGLDNTGYETSIILFLAFEYHLLAQHKN